MLVFRIVNELSLQQGRGCVFTLLNSASFYPYHVSHMDIHLLLGLGVVSGW